MTMINITAGIVIVITVITIIVYYYGYHSILFPLHAIRLKNEIRHKYGIPIGSL